MDPNIFNMLDIQESIYDKDKDKDKHIELSKFIKTIN